MKNKSIKDAIHGYINIEEPFWKIIDTAEFQRLKWIEQTSYRVLYPSARHDRFIHSIGVYHLGQKAFDGFLKNSSEKDALIVNKYKNSFLLACILHDIGHAPFSHTCEDLYNYQQKISDFNCSLNEELISAMKLHLNTEIFNTFVSDYKYILSPKGKSPSEHEIMSAIIACRKINEFKGFFQKSEQVDISIDLIVRAITGCCYEIKRDDCFLVNQEKGIKNCLIRLLNSSTVDVDKLDYIARDTQMSGYDNIVLDTERLLNSVCMIRDDNICYPSFKKSALSVINNVVIAKNLQAKWIVNHPIVIYDSYILRRAIGETIKEIAISANGTELDSDELIRFIFSSRSLSKEGHSYNDTTFTLLSDIEILGLMKGKMTIPSVCEYFARNERKSPIWKSHEEFLYCLDSEKNKAIEVTNYIAPLISYLNDVEDLGCPKQIDSTLYDEIKSSNDLEGKETLIQILETLKEYKNADGTVPSYNFVILPAKNRFFTKIDSKRLFICFNPNDPNGYTTYNTFENEQLEISSKKYEFFYIYSKDKIDSKDFLNYLYNQSHAHNSIRM